MQRDLLLLREMIDAAEQARNLVAGLSPSDVDADRMRRAVVHALEADR